MANIKSAKKRIRQSQKARLRNASHRSMLRTYMKKVHAAVADKNHEAASAAFRVVQPLLDRAADRKLFHKNKVARYKQRLNARIKALAAPSS